MSDLTIVILTYNSAHIIERAMQNLDFTAYKVVIVDNASKDNTVALVKEKFPLTHKTLTHKIIELPKNLGYGRGNDAALEQVDTPFALILNPDAIIEKKDIELVLSAMKKDDKVALAAPVMLKHFPFEQNEMDKRLRRIKEDYDLKKKNYFDKEGDNFLAKFLSGAALFMNVSIMREVGFFDKNIFLYFEDNEISQRVLKSGYKNLLVTNAIFYHPKGDASTIENSKIVWIKSWHFMWSRLYLLKKNEGAFVSKVEAVKFVLKSMVKVLLSLLSLRPKKALKRFAFVCGAAAFLFSLQAFDKNDKPRGV